METESRIRDAHGRFLPGNNANPLGRGAPRTLTQALREHVDPDEWAQQVAKRMYKSDQVLTYVGDRLEGKPKQATEVEYKGDPPAVKAIKELQQAMRNGNGASPK